MLKRTLTSAVLLPILAAFIIFGDLPLKLFISLLIAIGLFEVYSAFGGGKLKIVHYCGFVFAAVYLCFIDNLRNTNLMTIILISFILCLSTLLVIFHKKITIVDCAETLFGFCYVTILMSTIYLVQHFEPQGNVIVWLIFISAWGSDTGAYIFGWLFGRHGRHKLIPTLSAKKTWEGAVGGVFSATALSLLYALILSKTTTNNDPLQFLSFGIVGVLGGTFSQFGDLTASAIKRHTNIKDFGKLLPGHGGILDRFDSVLFTAPAVFLVMLLMMNRGFAL